MIQRIQSLFLLLASGASFGLFALPFATTQETITASTIFQDKIYTIQDDPILLGFFLIAAVLALASIFLFNNRGLQLKLSRFSAIATVLGIIMMIVVFMRDSNNMGESTPNEAMGLGLPILTLLCLFFAIRFITKDEHTVRSMDRLR